MIQVKEMTTGHRDSIGMQASKELKNMIGCRYNSKAVTFNAVADIACTYSADMRVGRRTR